MARKCKPCNGKERRAKTWHVKADIGPVRCVKAC